jgi:hypothetical protein
MFKMRSAELVLVALVLLSLMPAGADARKKKKEKAAAAPYLVSYASCLLHLCQHSTNYIYPDMYTY